MAKIKRTYALSVEAVKRLEDMALDASYARRERVALGVILEELIMQSAKKNLVTKETRRQQREWGTAAKKEGRSIIKKGTPRIGNTDGLDDLGG